MTGRMAGVGRLAARTPKEKAQPLENKSGNNINNFLIYHLLIKRGRDIRI